MVRVGRTVEQALPELEEVEVGHVGHLGQPLTQHFDGLVADLLVWNTSDIADTVDSPPL